MPAGATPLLPDLAPSSADALPALRRAAIAALLDHLESLLVRGPFADPTPLEDYSLRHLAKAVATARSTLALVEADRWPDACVLARAVFEQLFAYLWVARDPERAPVRIRMVDLKQEWANAKYLEALAERAEPAGRQALCDAAARCREAAGALLAELAGELGTSEKRVRDEATLRASLKAIEVNLGPPFSVPYAYYSGFVHSDGNALAAFAHDTAAGRVYSPSPPVAAAPPLAADLHRALLRLAREAVARCPRLDRSETRALLDAHEAWLLAAEAR